MKNTNEITDSTLFIRTSKNEIDTWDKVRITSTLVKEAKVTELLANAIANKVENFINQLNIKRITTVLVRELVDVELLREGLEIERSLHTRIGIPLYDVDRMITYPSKENANVPHGPEGTNLSIAEIIKKEYALERVFSNEVSTAHIKGDIHIHDLGFIDRPYCSGNNIAYVAKYGLNLIGSSNTAKPAKHAEVLLAHIIKFAAALQGCFAGAIGFDAVNVFFAPYIVNKSYDEIKQLAQMMIFEFNQQNVARGGQAIFSDINIYWEVPKHFRNVKAIGPDGKETGKVYGDYIKESQLFAKAIMEVYLEGDGCGRPFFWPKPDVHITNEFFKTPGHEEFLELLCTVAIEKGNTYFIFDRNDEVKISECCRLRINVLKEDITEATTPWKLRFCALQNVTINLPRIGYECCGDRDKAYQLLQERFKLVIEVHKAKKVFIEKLISLGTEGPLGLLCMNHDGENYLRMNKVSYLVGILGLNEMVKAITGYELHENTESFMFGLDFINRLRILAEDAKKSMGMNFILEQTPAESTTYRFARLDLKYYKEQAEKIVQGDITNGEVYYTNSTYLAAKSGIHFIDRVIKEGMFHPLIEAGSLCIEYNELIPIYHNNSFKVVKIGEFVENSLLHTTNIQTHLVDGTIQAELSEDIKAFGVNNNGGAFVRITHVTKIPINNKKMYTIKTITKKSITVTENHILFELCNGKLEEIVSQNITSGTAILVQPKVISNICITRVDFLKELLQYKDAVVVIDTEGIITKYVRDNNLKCPKSLYRGKIQLTLIEKLIPGFFTDLHIYIHNLKWKYYGSNNSGLDFSLKINYDLGLLIGFFLAQGHTYFSAKNGESFIGFTLYKDHTSYANTISNVFKEVFNRELIFKKIDNYIQANIADKSIFFFLRTICNIGDSSFAKVIPELLFIYNTDYLCGIIDGIFSGDGLKQNKPNWTSLTLTSPKLIEQIQIILTLLGINYTKTKIIPTGNKHIPYTLHINSAGFIKLMEVVPQYGKTLRYTDTKSKTTSYKLTPSATPFKYLYNKYLKNRSDIFIDRKQMVYLGSDANKATTFNTAILFADTWLNFLNQLKNNKLLVSRINMTILSNTLGLCTKVINKILHTDSYIKNTYYSEMSFNNVHNYDISLFIAEINQDIINLLNFKDIISKYTFDTVDTIDNFNNNPEFVYDFTVAGHIYSNLNGILCHNTHLWLGEAKPCVQGVANLIKKIFNNTTNDQVAISPEFTVCNKCDHIERGLYDICTSCGSNDTDYITRITGYFSKVSSWNKGKLGELKDRMRESI